MTHDIQRNLVRVHHGEIKGDADHFRGSSLDAAQVLQPRLNDDAQHLIPNP
jgi:hypothetical protein